MISGTLIKFEPTKEGITVMVRVPRDQMHAVVDLYEQEVTVEEGVVYGTVEPQPVDVILWDLEAQLKAFLRRIAEMRPAPPTDGATGA